MTAVTIQEIIGRNVARARETAEPTPAELEARRQQRRDGGISQAELADRLMHWLGPSKEKGGPWSRHAVSAAEAGKRAYAADELIALAFSLKQSVAWFFWTEEEEQIAMPSGEEVPGRRVLSSQIAASADPMARLEAIDDAAAVAEDLARELRVRLKGIRRAARAYNKAGHLLSDAFAKSESITPDEQRQDDDETAERRRAWKETNVKLKRAREGQS